MSNPARRRPFSRLIIAIICLLFIPAPSLAVEAERIPLDGPDEIRATMTVAASVERLLQALERPCELRQWIPQLERLEVLGEPGEGQTLVYIATDIGWPFSPRDGITLFTRRDGPPLRLEMESRPRAHPPVEGFARIPFSRGRWTLQALGPGSTRVGYAQRVTPGGLVPQWLSDQAGVSQAKNLLRALKRHVTRGDAPPCAAEGTDPEATRP